MSVLPHRVFLFKRSNGIYYIGYTRNGRKRWKSTGFTTKPDALKALTEFRHLVEEQRRFVFLEAFVGDFLSYAQANFGQRTFRLYRGILTRFLGFARDIPLVEITPEHIDRYKAKRLVDKTRVGRPVNPVTVNSELRAIRSAFGAAERWKLIDTNPFDGVSFAEVPQRAPSFLTIQDFQRLLDMIREGWLREVVVFAALTGLRRGEIVNLRWEHVDMSRRVVLIESGPTFKTKHGRRRTVPLNETAVRQLQAMHGRSLSPFVFTLNDKPIFADWITHLFKRYARRIGLGEHLHFHSLRHTFASWLVQGGATLYQVQHLLGHSSSKVTEAYSHLVASDLHDTVEKLKLN